ncbi:kelch domain-containing protein 10 homolog [Microplitis mediator]|uniref:kelch domain-containing protein 10 homolog n=1 Tax=Microplitis mediator TaxID=375433 RepID=UPI002555B235|nr:kelch domain-containing protein 10 homolog [Microplitis mediator]
MYSFKPFVFDQHDIKRSEVLRSKSDSKVCCDDKYLYCYSTYNIDTPEGFEDIAVEAWKFNLLTHSWTPLIHQETHVIDNSFEVGSIFEEGKLILLLKADTSPQFFYLSHWDLKTNELNIRKINRPLPKMGFDPNFFCHNLHLYAIGSQSKILYQRTANGPYKFFYIYDVLKMDLISKKWDIVYLCPDSDPFDWDRNPQYGEIFAFDGKKIYVFDTDESSQQPLISRRIFAFDLNCKQWNEMEVQKDLETEPGIPCMHGSYSFAQYKDAKGDVNIILTGGNINETSCNEIWRLNLATLQWTCISKFGVLPYRMRNHVAAIGPSGKMYVFDGMVEKGSGEVENTSIFSAWVTIPKLKEMAWEAVLFYNKELKEKSRTELIIRGYPPMFVERLTN